MIQFINQYFTDLTLAISMALVFLFCCIFFALFIYFRKKCRKTIYAKSHLSSSFSVDYVDILSNMDLGVLVFAADRRLLYANQKSRVFLPNFLDTDLTLDDFMDLYGSDNGLLAGLILGKKYLNGMVYEDERAILVDFKQFNVLAGEAVYLITLYDFTLRENLERQRNQFVANVSHELKTPLTTIVTYTESLLDWGLNESSKDQLSRDLQRIYDDGRRMQSLVNDLSLLSMLDNDGIRPRMEELDLNHLLRFCVDRAMMRAREKNILLEYHSTDNIPLAYGERASIERIITNLVENAIKYTPRQGYVKVYLNFVQDDIYIKVKDNGIGISKENLPFIFDRFYRVDNSGSSVFGGTGLGLSIAKELVELHRGQMTVSSQQGSGSEFIVILPSAARLIRECIHAHRINQPKDSALFESLTKMLLHDLGKLEPSVSKLSELNDAQEQRLFEHVTAASDSYNAFDSLSSVETDKHVDQHSSNLEDANIPDESDEEDVDNLVKSKASRCDISEVENKRDGISEMKSDEVANDIDCIKDADESSFFHSNQDGESKNEL